jgi:hypothetical protein
LNFISNVIKHAVKYRCKHFKVFRAVARPIIGGGGGGDSGVGGGGVYSYIRVLPDGFLLKAIVFTVCEHEYMNIHTPAIIASGTYGPESVS